MEKASWNMEKVTGKDLQVSDVKRLGSQSLVRLSVGKVVVWQYSRKCLACFLPCRNTTSAQRCRSVWRGIHFTRISYHLDLRTRNMLLSVEGNSQAHVGHRAAMLTCNDFRRCCRKLPLRVCCRPRPARGHTCSEVSAHRQLTCV